MASDDQTSESTEKPKLKPGWRILPNGVHLYEAWVVEEYKEPKHLLVKHLD